MLGVARCCFSSAVLINGVDEEVGDGPVSGSESEATCLVASLSDLSESVSEEPPVVEVVEMHIPECILAERPTRSMFLEMLDMTAVLAEGISSLPYLDSLRPYLLSSLREYYNRELP